MEIAVNKGYSEKPIPGSTMNLRITKEQLGKIAGWLEDSYSEVIYIGLDRVTIPDNVSDWSTECCKRNDEIAYVLDGKVYIRSF